ncbi:MAG: hypothetical protein ACWGSQ_01965 [Longimicrobiales bacterium]
MSNDDSKRRLYSEEEFALILRKATELQEPGPKGSGRRTGRGLSLEEIQSIAAEAGIDTQAVSRAAALLGALEWEEKKGLAAAIFGSPGTYHLEFEVPGRLLPEEYSRLLDLIRRIMEHQGEASEVLGGVAWKTVGQLSIVNVNISPRGESTSIQIVADRGGAGALTFTFPVAGAAVLTGALGAIFEPTTAVGIVGLVGGLLGSGFLFARTLWVSQGKKFHRRLTRLMDELSGAVGRAALPSGTPSSEGPSAGDG